MAPGSGQGIGPGSMHHTLRAGTRPRTDPPTLNARGRVPVHHKIHVGFVNACTWTLEEGSEDTLNSSHAFTTLAAGAQNRPSLAPSCASQSCKQTGQREDGQARLLQRPTHPCQRRWWPRQLCRHPLTSRSGSAQQQH